MSDQHQPWPTQPPQQPQPRKRKVWPWILAAVVFIGLPILLFVSCTAAVGSAVNEANQPVSLRYEVTGDTATITYTTAGGMTQAGEVSPPWSQQVDFTEGITAFGSLTATLSADGGKVTCRIVKGDAVVAENTASGAFSSANCSGK